MKNKMPDLKNHLYTALERLNDESLSEEQIRFEISRAQAVAHLGKVLVEQAKTALLYAKLTGQKLEGEEFEEPKKITRPESVYSNKKHVA
jgi:competence protein ComGF